MKFEMIYLGLRGKLVLYLLVPSCLVVGALLHIYNQDLNEVLYQKYVEQALLDATSLQSKFSAVETLQNPKILETLIDEFLTSHRQYLKVNIYGSTDHGHLVLASSEPTLIGQEVSEDDIAPLVRGKPSVHEEVEEGQKILETVVPFFLEGKTAGAIGLYTPLDPKDALISHLRSRMLKIGPLGIGVLLLILYLLVNKMIVSPVRRLAGHTEDISRGNYHGRISVKGNDEVANLGRAFNQMCASIQLAKQALEQLSHQNELILESAGEGIYGLDLQGKTTFVNPAAARMIRWEAEEIMGQAMHTILHHSKPDGTPYPQEACPIYAAFRDGAVHQVDNEVFWRKDGTSFPVEYISTPIWEEGRLVGAVVTFRDITERKHTGEMLQTEQEFLKTVLDNISDGIVACNASGVLTLFNRAIQELHGLPQVPIPADQWAQHYDLYMPDGKTPMRKEDIPLFRALQGEIVQNQEVVILPKQGKRRTVLASGRALTNAKGEKIGAVVAAHDITERKQAEEALAEQAIRDVLTNLYNRRYFNYRMEEEIARADRNKDLLAILLCDLDHFKTINDAWGHQAGDEVLKAVAKGIQEATRGTDLVFRWGGDEFVVLLSHVNREGILIAADRIRRGVRTISERADLAPDVSIGVALYPEHARTVDELIRLADRALYIAKKGGDKIHIGEEEYCLDEHSIKVVFQPVVDLRSGETLGYEALSRDPQGKLSILELFKRYQAIGQLGELKRLCFTSQVKAACAAKLKRVFLNVSFDLLNQLGSVPKPAGMEVILEISELEALHDVEAHLKIARMWQKQGFKFAIDDFGAGFISLPFIAKVIPDYIKVDRSTILQAVSSRKFKRFLKDLVLALDNYSTEGIIAEGIETEKELQVVKDMGIYIVQGFLMGKPEAPK